MGDFTAEEWEAVQGRLARVMAVDPTLWLTRLSNLIDDAASEAKGNCAPHNAAYLWDVQEKLAKAMDEFGR